MIKQIFYYILLIFLISIVSSKNIEKFDNILLKKKSLIRYPTKCFSCERQMPEMGHPTKCFSCERQNSLISYPTKCFSCEMQTIKDL